MRSLTLYISEIVQKAKNLLIKGKNGTNNCFVTIGLGKEKYQTSIKEKVSRDVNWHEECELTIPDQGNKAELILTCLHRNTLGIDEFLGQVVFPLKEMDVYERPRSKWYKLESKPGKEKKKERGEIEARILFVVKSGSVTDLNKKEKSLNQLTSSIGGSLLSVGTMEKKKKFKKFAKSLSSRLSVRSKSKHEIRDTDSDLSGSLSSINTSVNARQKFGQTKDDADPGVISEDEDEFIFENLSHKSSENSLNMNKIDRQFSSLPKKDENDVKLNLPVLSSSETNDRSDEWKTKLHERNLNIGNRDELKRRSWGSATLHSDEKVLEERKANINLVQNELDTESRQLEQNFQNKVVPKSPILRLKNFSSDQSKLKSINLEQPVGLSRSNTTGNLLESIRKEAENERSDKIEKKRFVKLKYFRKDKEENLDCGQFSERIIVGHESYILKTGDKLEISEEILKKYKGKSKEEIILLANGLENEVCYQRQRIKELEEYLDNLLLRVMETQPKILQNPYDRNIFTKSG